MATQVNRRRGTTAQHAAFTGALAETTYDTDKKVAVVHDGATVGGFPLAAQHLAQTFVPSQTFANTENFFGSTATNDNKISFLGPVGAGTSTLDFRTNGTPDLNFIRKYSTTPFQIEIGGSGGVDIVTDTNNNETAAQIRFLTNGVRGSGTQTLLFTVQDNGVLVATGALNMGTNLINNVVNPVGAQDAATKTYVDAGDAATLLIAAPPFADTTALVKGSADATKLLRFEVDGFTAGATRVLTPPDADINLPGTNIANTWTAAQTFQLSALGVTTSPNVTLVNPTAAAVNAQQVSPALQFEGFGWKTDAIAASQSVRWRQFVFPVQATVEPTAELHFQTSVNAAAFTSMLTLRSSSVHTLNGSLVMNSTLTGMTGVTLADAALLFWLTRTVLSSPADGVLRLTNNAQSDFTRLALGGTTSSFPALGRVGTGLELLAADGTGNSNFLRIYESKVTATDFERLAIGFNGSEFFILTENGTTGAGIARDLILGTDEAERLRISATGQISWGSVTSFLETDGSITIDTDLFVANVTTGVVNIASVLSLDRGGLSIGFFTAVGTPATQQNVVTLTNNVGGAGGSPDIIDDFAEDSGTASLGADLMDQTTVPDKATLDAILGLIRGDMAQMAGKVEQIRTALANYGLVV